MKKIALLLAAALIPLFMTNPAKAGKPFKVLVVFSYEADFPWNLEIRQGINQALSGVAELHYFYMNTKTRPQDGEQQAALAYQRYLELQPDGVIASDDDAQRLFVVPYLREKVATPVVFCGVNAEPQLYGYPAANVTGIVERFHLEESIAFVRLFAPEVKSFAFMIKKSPVADLIAAQLQAEAELLSARQVAFVQPETLAEAVGFAKSLRDQADLLFVETLRGVADRNGRPLDDREVMPQVVAVFGKPTAGTNRYAVEYGVFSAVVKNGEEQGGEAARKMLQIFAGTPLAEIPITRNYRGRRLLNVKTLQALQIDPNPIALRGVELIAPQ